MWQIVRRGGSVYVLPFCLFLKKQLAIFSIFHFLFSLLTFSTYKVGLKSLHNHSYNLIVVSYLVKLGVCQIHWCFAQIIFLACFVSHGGLNKDPSVKLDGATQPPMSLIMSSINSWFIELSLYGINSQQKINLVSDWKICMFLSDM